MNSTPSARGRSLARFVNMFVSPGTNDATNETIVTLAQGLSNTKHTLEISGGEATPIAAIRVYRPPLRGEVTIKVPDSR